MIRNILVRFNEKHCFKINIKEGWINTLQHGFDYDIPSAILRFICWSYDDFLLQKKGSVDLESIARDIDSAEILFEGDKYKIYLSFNENGEGNLCNITTLDDELVVNKYFTDPVEIGEKYKNEKLTSLLDFSGSYDPMFFIKEDVIKDIKDDIKIFYEERAESDEKVFKAYCKLLPSLGFEDVEIELNEYYGGKTVNYNYRGEQISAKNMGSGFLYLTKHLPSYIKAIQEKGIYISYQVGYSLHPILTERLWRSGVRGLWGSDLTGLTLIRSACVTYKDLSNVIDI